MTAGSRHDGERPRPESGTAPRPHLRAVPRPVATGPLVVLVGPMGVGKSTVGRLLAERLGVAHRDTDDDLVTDQGKSVAELFGEHGEAGFRALEKEAVRVALAEHEGVLSLGGGAVLEQDTRSLLAGRHVVWLSMAGTEAVRRLADEGTRPLLAGDAAGRWAALARARRSLYEEVAACHVPTDGRTPAQVVAAVLETLPRRSSALPEP